MTFLALLLALLGSPHRVGDDLIAALTKMEPGITYSTDGAADVSVMTIGQNDYGITDHPPVVLEEIVALGTDALPLLISHLDTTTSTQHRFEDGDVRVPVGFVCLDILLAVTDGPMHVKDCTDDGFGACVAESYFFRPDSSQKEVAAVKKRWETAVAAGRVKFVRPSWWAGGY